MYQALYRKWRPKTFADMVGQEHVTKTLVRQVETNRLSHAYLLTGTRGTGKTSCAKVLAKAVNCTNLQNGDPCNSCSACQGIDDGSILDVLELDAASNNGVDQVRALRDEAVYTPGSVKKRVYIIDEVHMLTDSAENALLKILEEPPEHLLFILATTEQHKVMATIRSRCQQFTFKRILPQDISQRLTYISQQEEINLSPEGANLLARLADGGLRDALSLLDQCRNSDAVGEEHILQVLGLAGNLETSKLMESVAQKDSEQALIQLGKLYENGRDIGSVLEELSVLARDLLLLKTAPNHGSSLLAGGYDQETLDRLGKLLPAPQLLYTLTVLQESTNKLTKSSHRRTDGELCLLRLCEPSLEDSTVALSARIARLEAGLNTAPPVATQPPLMAPPVVTPSTVAPPMAPPVVTPSTVAPPMAPPVVAPSTVAPPLKKQAPQTENELFYEPPPWLDEDNVPDGLFGGFDDFEESLPQKQLSPPITAPMVQSPMTTQAVAPIVEQSKPVAPPVTAMPAATPSIGNTNTGSGEFWPTFCPKLQNKVPAAAWPYFIGNPAKVVGRYIPGVLTLWVNQAFTKKRLEIPGCIEGVQSAASEFFGTTVQVVMQIGAAPADTAIAATTPTSMPIMASTSPNNETKAPSVASEPPPQMAEPIATPEATQSPPQMAEPIATPVATQPPPQMAEPIVVPEATQPPPQMAEPIVVPEATQPPSQMAEPIATQEATQPLSQMAEPIISEEMPSTTVEAELSPMETMNVPSDDPLDELISLENMLNEE